MAGRLRSLRVLLQLAWRADPLRSVLAPVLLVSAGIGSMLLPWWLKVGLDAVLARSDSRLVVASVGFALTLAAFFGFASVGSRVSRRLMENLAFATSTQVAGLVASLPTLDIFERADDVQRLATLRERRQDFGGLINGTVNLAGQAARLGVAVVLLWAVHPALTLLLPATLVVATAAFRSQERVAEAEANEAWRWGVLERLESIVLDGPTAKEVKAWAAARHLAGRHRQLGQQPKELLDARWKGARFQALGGLGLALTYGAAVGWVGLGGMTDAVTPGTLLLIILVVTRMNEAAIQMIPYGTWMAQALVLPESLEWLRSLHRRATERGRASVAVPSGALRLEDMTFTYPGADGPALDHVNLDLAPNSIVALVGPNGAGKTTLVKLLIGLHAPSRGRIMVNGQDIGAVPPEAWRQRLSGAFQDAQQFHLSLRHAIGIGDLAGVDDRAAIDAALELADAQHLVALLPEGLDTQLGTDFGGVDLSSGQWQLVALARGLMRHDPLVLLLDEPTAPLDAEAEERHYQRIIRGARRSQQAGRITLLVTHRMAGAAFADKVVMLEHGRVSEVGSHTELLAARGAYARFYAMQAAGYQDADRAGGRPPSASLGTEHRGPRSPAR